MTDYKARNTAIKRILKGVFAGSQFSVISVNAWRGMMVGHAVDVRILDGGKMNVKELRDFVLFLFEG
jgi:hypothetical protein